MKQLICVVLLAAVVGAEIPTSLCKIKDAEFNECVRKTLQDNIGKLSKEGLKDIGFPKLDPFYVPELLMSYDNEELKAKSIVRNSYTRGMRNTKFLAFRSKLDDPKDMRMELDFNLPKVLVEGTYKTEGKIAQLVLNGKGVYNISMTNVSATAKVEGELVEKDGKEYLRVQRISMRPTVGSMKIYATNLVDGNPELSAAALAFSNQFWRPLYEQMLPYAEEGFDKILRGMANQYTMKVPFNKIFNTE